jgi:hypothetical protein
MLDIRRCWISEVQNQSESNCDDLQSSEKQTPPRGPKQDRQADCLVIAENTNLKKLLVEGRGKGSAKCVLCIRSEVRLDTFVNSALFRFTKGHVLRRTIQ